MAYNGDILDLGMACDAFGVDRRNLTVSVVILGLTLSTVFLAYYSFGDASGDSDIARIKFAAFVFRHGERSPSDSYPNDPHINHSWIGGLGSLSPRGALQMYNLGKKLANRYKKLIPSNGFYTTNEMYVLSSAHERCLMSGQSFLAGFLPPPVEGNTHKLPINWQPIAVNSVPRDRDRLISQKAVCSKYDKLLYQLYNDPPEHIQEYLKSIAELLAYCKEHAGGNITTLNHIERLYNILYIQEINGLKLPDWTRSIYPEKLLSVAERNLALLTETNFMKRIRGGSLVTNIYQLMSKEPTIKNPSRNLYIYSGHDVTLVNVMRALNISAQTADKPDFGATIYFELHENQSSGPLEVKIFYSSSADNNDLKSIEIPGCDAPCYLSTFRNVIDPIYVTDYDAECAETSIL